MAGRALTGHRVLAIVAVAAIGASAGYGCSSSKKPKPQNATTTTSSTAAAPATTAPAAAPIVSSTLCGLSRATDGEPDKVDAPAPRSLAGVSPGTAARLGSYLASFKEGQAGVTTLAPVGWQCHAFEYGTGGVAFYVYPPSAQSAFTGPDAFETSEHYAGEEVKITTGSLVTGSGLDVACSFFADEQIVRSHRESCGLATGRKVAGVGNGVVPFTDADGAVGVAIMDVRSSDPLDGSFSAVSCRLQPARASLCDTILDDYLARNTPSPKVAADSWKVEEAQPGVPVLVHRDKSGVKTGVVDLPHTLPTDAKTVTDGRTVYVIGGGDGGYPYVVLVRVDVATQKLVGRPVTLALSPDGYVAGPLLFGGSLWLGVQRPEQGSLRRVDPVTGREVAKIALPAQPATIVANGGSVLVALAGGRSVSVDPIKNQLQP